MSTELHPGICRSPIFARNGLVEGMSGPIPLRNPENTHTFWINPVGCARPLMCVLGMVLVDYEMYVIGRNMSLPSNGAGLLIHNALHKRRPHVNAARHAHSIYGKVWPAFRRPQEIIPSPIYLACRLTRLPR